ncbi:MAG: (d)CMP kinase [Solobacterium sp.]|jgi:cytidylate kinase|nr:(d)CMP kinase [Solobacterium sp.]
MRRINIAIDGPSAAGKSSISDMLAEKYGYVHVDTGAMYRCLGLNALRSGVSDQDEEALCRLLAETEIELHTDGSVYMNGEDVSKAIRSDEVSMLASNVSKWKNVRAEMVRRQQKMAEAKGFIMDGRDIGTVVLTDAEVKIFLTASAEARAKRRWLQNQAAGITGHTLEELRDEIARRDEQDSGRENSPLKQAEDAVLVDSSDLSKEEVVEVISALVDRACAEEES